MPSWPCCAGWSTRLFPRATPLDDFQRQQVAESAVRTIYIHAHMDEDTFDCSRAMLCPDLVPAEPGRLIPACTYNLFYRMQDTRFFEPQDVGRTAVDAAATAVASGSLSAHRSPAACRHLARRVWQDPRHHRVGLRSLPATACRPRSRATGTRRLLREASVRSTATAVYWSAGDLADYLESLRYVKPAWIPQRASRPV